jgi:hypothetical protein
MLQEAFQDMKRPLLQKWQIIFTIFSTGNKFYNGKKCFSSSSTPYLLFFIKNNQNILGKFFD